MTRKRKHYKTYIKEFKLDALRLMEQSDRPASEIRDAIKKT
jgi:transposase